MKLDIATLDAAGELLSIAWSDEQSDPIWPNLAASTLAQAVRDGVVLRSRENARGVMQLTVVRDCQRSLVAGEGPERAVGFLCVRKQKAPLLLRGWQWILAAGFGLAAATLGWNMWSGRRLARLTRLLTQACEAIGRGELAGCVDVQRDDELGELAEALGLMSVEMAQRVEQARQVGDQLAAVLRGMEDAVVAINEHREILFANPAAQRLFGAASPARGRRLAELVRNRALHEAVSTFFERGEARCIELEWGSEQLALSVMLTEMSGETRSGLILSFHDLTELRRLESLRQEFVANVSHELKTPLSSIKAYAETLREGALNDTSRRLVFIERIEEQADRLHELILDMISLARIEAGQQSFDISAVSVAWVADRCVAARQDACLRKQVALAVDPASPPHALVAADEEGLRQILDNLVDNAVKYTPQGGKVTVRWGPAAGSPSSVAIEVEDTGIGIPEQALPRVFERFYRVDRARRAQFGGHRSGTFHRQALGAGLWRRRLGGQPPASWQYVSRGAARLAKPLKTWRGKRCRRVPAPAGAQRHGPARDALQRFHNPGRLWVGRIVS